MFVSDGSSRMSEKALESFLREQQKETLGTAPLMERGLAGTGNGGEGGTAEPRASDAGSHVSGDGTMGFMQFQRFLLSKDNCCVHPHEMLGPVDDMNRPLGDYYMNSSHNTYCSGDQLTDESKVQMYIDALLRGTRCVELDCWDPDSPSHNDEPIIYHGHTLTSKIHFRDVIQGIRDYAFVASPYPVVLSLEVHCTKPYQAKMAAIMKQIFGDYLSRDIPDNTRPLPTPEELKYKILLKGKSNPDEAILYADGAIEEMEETEEEKTIRLEFENQKKVDKVKEFEAKREYATDHKLSNEKTRQGIMDNAQKVKLQAQATAQLKAAALDQKEMKVHPVLSELILTLTLNEGPSCFVRVDTNPNPK